ncbi:MAG: histidine phosphatase family protein [Conexivisphaerales archaeon]
MRLGALLVYCLRHAESTANANHYLPDDNNAPPVLTEKGIMQAIEIARILSKLRIQAIYASPMLRTRQTAEYISKEIGIDYQVDARLKELELGSLAGKDYLLLNRDDPSWYDELFSGSSKYGLEKFPTVKARVISLVNEAYKKGLSSVLLVSHMEPIRAIVAEAMNDDGRFVRKIRLDNASLSILAYDGRSYSVKCINWIPVTNYRE